MLIHTQGGRGSRPLNSLPSPPFPPYGKVQKNEDFKIKITAGVSFARVCHHTHRVRTRVEELRVCKHLLAVHVLFQRRQRQNVLESLPSVQVRGVSLANLPAGSLNRVQTGLYLAQDLSAGLTKVKRTFRCTKNYIYNYNMLLCRLQSFFSLVFANF